MKVTVSGVSASLVNVNFITSTGSDGSILNVSSGPSSVPSSVKASVGLSAGESTSISSKSDGVLKIASVPSSQPKYVDVELLVEVVEVLVDEDVDGLDDVELVEVVVVEVDGMDDVELDVELVEVDSVVDVEDVEDVNTYSGCSSSPHMCNSVT